jgi:HD-GYP domain-containing protein (c-di-GMP phosphodiesterase class II)
MKQSSPAVRIYVGLLATAATLTLAVLWQSFPFSMVSRDAFFAVTLGALIALSNLYPLPLAPNKKLTIGAAPTLMAVFLLPQPLAVTTSLLGVALGETLVGAPPKQFTFAVARNTLQTTLAALTARSCLPCETFVAGEASLLATLAVAACSYVVMGSILTAGFHALHLRQSPFVSWWQRRHEELVYQIAIASLGIFAVLSVSAHPWALAMIVFPIAIFYQAFGGAVQRQLREKSEATVESLADAVDQQDPRTNGHSRRVADLSRRIALHMGIDEVEAKNIYLAARVHDIGKLSVKNPILAKEEPLTDAEQQELRSYVEASARLIGQIPEFHGGRNYILYIRERWDGQGYPMGLRGEQIPTGARIIAVADAYDAMTSDRPHRPALRNDQVVTELTRNRYVQWDGAVVDALLEIIASGSLNEVSEGAPSSISARGVEVD